MEAPQYIRLSSLRTFLLQISPQKMDSRLSILKKGPFHVAQATANNPL